MTGDQPVGVVGVGELEQRQAQVLDGLEVPHPQQVFLESADKTLGNAVALGLAHEGRRGVDAEEGDLVLEVVRHVVGAVVVAEFEPGSDVLADSAEVLAHALPDRLQGLKAVGALVGAVEWSTATKTWATPSARVTVWLMSVPHMTSTASAVMLPSCALFRPLADTVRRQQPVLPHQAPHPAG